jgi:hypothetical protein
MHVLALPERKLEKMAAQRAIILQKTGLRTRITELITSLVG